jgi:hypothetical protein
MTGDGRRSPRFGGERHPPHASILFPKPKGDREKMFGKASP